MSKHKMLQKISNKTMAFDKTRWRIFADWLKKEREKANLSQDGLADLVGVDRQTIYRLENALSGTKRETVLAIADALKVDSSTALTKAGFAGQDSPTSPLIYEALAREGTLSENDEIFLADLIIKLKKANN